MSTWSFAIAFVVSIAACGGKESGSAAVKVGGFTVKLPAGWKHTKDKRLGAGKEMLASTTLTAILEPMAEPLAVDPTEEATCRVYAGQLEDRGMKVAHSEVTTVPAGKACAVEASAILSSGRQRWVRERVIGVGGHGLSVQCSASDAAALAGCAALFDAITVTGA